jgi:hypothetical protein
LAGPGSGPALYLGPEPEAPAIGYVSPGVPLRIKSAPTSGRIRVLIAGGLMVRGWLPLERLAGRVQKRGRVPNTPAYLGPNDVVGIAEEADRRELMRLRVTPRLRQGITTEPFEGIFPAARIGDDAVDPKNVEGPTPGTRMELPADTAVPLYDKPGGEVVVTLPALDPPLVVSVLRERGQWKGVRAGIGPYVVGFVNAPLTATERVPADADPVLGSISPVDGQPDRIEAESSRPLHRLPKGTKIKFTDTTIAQLAEEGWAREMNRFEDTGEADVFVAVDNRAAVRGLVDISALQPVQ